MLHRSSNGIPSPISRSVNRNGSNLRKSQNAVPKRPKSPLAGHSYTPNGSKKKEIDIKAIQKEDITLVLFRADNADGRAAAYASYITLGDNINYRPVKHGDALPINLKNQTVILLGFCYPAVQMLDLIQQTKGQFLVIDHDRGQLEAALKDVSESHYILSKTRSSCVLAWNFFVMWVTVPLFYNYIEDQDLWKWDMINSRAFSLGWKAVSETCVWSGEPKKDFDPFVKLIYGGSKTFKSVVSKGHAIMEYQSSIITHHVKQAQSRRLCKRPLWKCRVVNATILQTEIAKVLYKAPQFDCDVAIIWSFEHSTFHLGHFNQYSLKVILKSSHYDFNVGALAEKYGGGGNARTAEFNLSMKQTGGHGIEYLFDLEDELENVNEI